jgi:hypothetical protein
MTAMLRRDSHKTQAICARELGDETLLTYTREPPAGQDGHADDFRSPPASDAI